MKLLVFSDSHGRYQRMLDVLAEEGKEAAACFFLGDGLRDAESIPAVFPRLPFYAVQGNCDFAAFEPAEGLAPFGGFLFFYTHGHAYHVKSSLLELARTAKQRGAEIALFGHTHVPQIEQLNGITLFNPGSITLPRSGPPTYGRITLTAGQNPVFEICPWQ